MKLTSILQEVLSEIGDASATGFTLKKPSNIKGLIQKLIDRINSDKINKEYGGYALFKTKYVASIGNNKYNIDISGEVWNTTPGTVSRFTYLFKPNGSRKPGHLKIRVDFDIKRADKKDNDYASTELNEQYKVLAAVFQSVMHFVNETESTTPVDQISITPAGDKGDVAANDSKRGRMYMMYVQKNLSKLPDPSMWKVEVLDKESDSTTVLSRTPPMPTKKGKKK